MKMHIWGTRGSTPAPGKNTQEFGGNTSCVEVTLSNSAPLIIDAGTGIRPLGLDYLSRNGAPKTFHLLISHAHWDHIQGFPFFVPAFLADFTIHIYSHLDMREVLTVQMSQPYFPVSLSQLSSKLVFHTLGDTPVAIETATVSFLSLKHPQEVYGFRIQDGDSSIVYSSDTEHEAQGTDSALINFSRGAGALLYDAQYTPDQYRKGRVGWGHSTYEAAAEIAKSAGVGKLVLIHHEPTHDDETLRAIEASAQKLFPDTISAREGMTLEV